MLSDTSSEVPHAVDAAALRPPVPCPNRIPNSRGRFSHLRRLRLPAYQVKESLKSGLSHRESASLPKCLVRHNPITMGRTAIIDVAHAAHKRKLTLRVISAFYVHVRHDKRLRDDMEAHRVIELLEPAFRGHWNVGFSGSTVADLEAIIANLRGI